MQLRSWESNISKPLTLEAYRMTFALCGICCVGVPTARRGEHCNWLTAVGVEPSNTGNNVLVAVAERQKNNDLRIEKIRGGINPTDLMTKHLDGKRPTMLCSLLSIKHIGGRPSSAPS